MRILGLGLVLAACCSAVFAAEPEPRYEWVQVTAKAAFAPRDGAGALSFNGRMYLIGGWNPEDRKNFPLICNNEVWSSVDGKEWRLDKPNTHFDRTFDATRLGHRRGCGQKNDSAQHQVSHQDLHGL